MSNKNNNLEYQKRETLKNSDSSFKEKAANVEKSTPIGTTSGMGQDNYYFHGGKAYNSYKEAVNDLSSKK